MMNATGCTGGGVDTREGTHPQTPYYQMTYQEKFEELQALFSKTFDVYEQLRKELSLDNGRSVEFLRATAEFEKVSHDFQAFLIMFKENNASPGDEFGSEGERCADEIMKT